MQLYLLFVDCPERLFCLVLLLGSTGTVRDVGPVQKEHAERFLQETFVAEAQKEGVLCEV